MLKRAFSITVFLVILSIADIGVWYLVFYIPEPMFMDGLTSLFLVLFISLANLIVGVVAFFIRKWMFIPFAINSVLLFFIMASLSRADYQRKIDMLYQTWEFTFDGDQYRVTRYVYEPVGDGEDYAWFFHDFNTFTISKFGEGWESGSFYDGTTFERGDTIYFSGSDSTRFYLLKDCLYGFRGVDSIKLIRK